jgi:hypothetical protein
MTPAQIAAQVQSGALFAVDPSVCVSGYTQAIGGCIPGAPATGISWGTWLMGALILGGIGWYLWGKI